MTVLALIIHEPQAIVARRGREAITAARFVSDVHALAEKLPSCQYLVNYCHDRYRFAVGLGAALLNRQVTLLPQGTASGVLQLLAHDYSDSCLLCDGEEPADAGLPIIRYPDLPCSDPTLPVPQFPAAQPAIVLFTSGSTGAPQPHPRSWGALVHSARAAGERLLTDALRGATLVATVPHQHSYGIESSVMLALQNGLALDAGRPLLPADIAVRLAQLPRPTILVTTPVHLKALVADPGPADLILSATAPLSQQLARQVEDVFATSLQEIYGCSEAGQLATRRTARAEEWDCLPGVTLEKTDAGTVAHGLPVAAEIPLSDVIEVLTPSRFRLHGRMADMVNIAGKRSSLAHLNFHLNAVPGVIDGVFLAPDNDEPSHRLTALVVAPGIERDAILAALRHNLDPAFLPRPLILVEALPRNELGKLPRQALLELARSGGQG